MFVLNEVIGAWGTPAFEACFKTAVEQLPAAQLPLQQGLAQTSHVSSEPFRVMVLASSAERGVVRVKAGVFYSGIIAGCSCADDPTPIDVVAEHCELLFEIEQKSGNTRVTLLP